MLRLQSATSPAWVDHALANLDVLLLDHAHCEKKAASTALSLIFRYPEHSCLLTPLSELAREELEHFELVLEVIRSRGVERDHDDVGGRGRCGVTRHERGQEQGNHSSSPAACP